MARLLMIVVLAICGHLLLSANAKADCGPQPGWLPGGENRLSDWTRCKSDEAVKKAADDFAKKEEARKNKEKEDCNHNIKGDCETVGGTTKKQAGFQADPEDGKQPICDTPPKCPGQRGNVPAKPPVIVVIVRKTTPVSEMVQRLRAWALTQQRLRGRGGVLGGFGCDNPAAMCDPDFGQR